MKEELKDSPGDIDPEVKALEDAKKLIADKANERRKKCIEEVNLVYQKYGFEVSIHHPEPVIYLKDMIA